MNYDLSFQELAKLQMEGISKQRSFTLEEKKGTSEANQGKKPDAEFEERKVREFIDENNLWYSERLDESNYIDRGVEHLVYEDPRSEDFVVKTNNLIFFNSWSEYFTNLLLHNYFFPATSYELIGFIKTERGKILPVVRQPFIEKDEFTNTQDVEKFLLGKNFVRTHPSFNVYENKDLGITIGDLHEGNVIIKDDTPHFIDTKFFLSPLADYDFKQGGKTPEDIFKEYGDLRKVNKYVQEKYPKLQVAQGKGYMYWNSDDDELSLKLAGLYTTSIPIAKASHQSIGTWLREADEIMEEVNNPEYAGGGYVRKSDVDEIIATINKQKERGQPAVWENNYVSYVHRADGEMFRWDKIAEKNAYKTYTDVDKFARAVVRFKNRGYEEGGIVGGNYSFKNDFGSFTSVKIMPVDENLRASKDYFTVAITVRRKGEGEDYHIQGPKYKTFPISAYESYMEDLKNRGAEKYEDGGKTDDFDSLKDIPNFNQNLTKDEINNVISGASEVINGESIQAALRKLRRGQSPSSPASGAKPDKRQEEAILNKYIAFIPNLPSRYFSEGTEHRVHLEEDGKHVIKLNSGYFYNSWEDYLNNLLLHNYFFPATAYDLLGFTEENGKLFSVVRQRYIPSNEPTDLSKVKEFLSEKGFANTRNDDYYNEQLGVILEDLHNQNIIIHNGFLYFIDTVFYLSDKVKKLFGGEVEKAPNYDKLKWAKSKLNFIPDTKIWNRTGWIYNEEHGKWRFELNDKESSFKISPDTLVNNFKEDKYKYTVGEILDYDSFYYLYPEAKNILFFIVLDPRQENLIEADSFLSTEKKFVIVITIKNIDAYEIIRTNYEGSQRLHRKFKAVLLHELQHFLQARHSFAEAKGFDQINGVVQRIGKDTWHRASSLEEGSSKNRLLELAEEISNNSDTIAYLIYWFQPAELEAFNVYDRSDLTEKQRKEIPPYPLPNFTDIYNRKSPFGDGGYIPGSMTMEREAKRIAEMERLYPDGLTVMEREALWRYWNKKAKQRPWAEIQAGIDRIKERERIAKEKMKHNNFSKPMVGLYHDHFYILYLHGLDATPKSDHVDILNQEHVTIIAPEIDYKSRNVWQTLSQIILNNRIDAIVAHSLGGKYAYYLSNRFGKPALIFNPVIENDEDIPKGEGPNEIINRIPYDEQIFILGTEDTEFPIAKKLKFLENVNGRIYAVQMGHDVPDDIKLKYFNLFLDSLKWGDQESRIVKTSHPKWASDIAPKDIKSILPKIKDTMGIMNLLYGDGKMDKARERELLLKYPHLNNKGISKENKQDVLYHEIRYIPIDRLVSYKEKLYNTQKDIEKGILSRSKNIPLVVTFLPSMKNFLIQDGNHRLLELISEGHKIFPATINTTQAELYAFQIDRDNLIGVNEFVSNKNIQTKERGGLVVGPRHTEGGVPFTIKDTGQPIEEEGLEVNIPGEVSEDKNIYTFTGSNHEIIDKILGKFNLKLSDKVTTVISGDIVICIKSVWDPTIRTYTGTLTQILSAINTSNGCKLIERGAEVVKHSS